MKLPQGFSSMTPADTLGVWFQNKLHICQCTDTSCNLYNKLHRQKDQAKKKKKRVTDGFIQWQMDTLTFFRTISAIKCSLDEYRFLSPPKS